MMVVSCRGPNGLIPTLYVPQVRNDVLVMNSDANSDLLEERLRVVEAPFGRGV